MTREQQNILNKCKRMLKLVFPSLDGKLVFRLTPGDRDVKVAFVDNDACGDAVGSEETVDLRNSVAV